MRHRTVVTGGYMSLINDKLLDVIWYIMKRKICIRLTFYNWMVLVIVLHPKIDVNMFWSMVKTKFKKIIIGI